MSVRIGMIKVRPGLERAEKVDIHQLRAAEWDNLKRVRDINDACARAENALLKYYKRTRLNQEIVLTVMAAA